MVHSDPTDLQMQVKRRLRPGPSGTNLPRYSISIDHDDSPVKELLSPVHEGGRMTDTPTKGSPGRKINSVAGPALPGVVRNRSRSVIKSASASGLSLIIPPGESPSMLDFLNCDTYFLVLV